MEVLINEIANAGVTILFVIVALIAVNYVGEKL